MKHFFETANINGMTLRNRSVRSAVWEGMAGEDGAVTKNLVGLMADLAAGEVGLIITGHAYVAAEGQAGPWQLGVHTDDALPGLKRMTDAVHDAGGRIMLQMAHSGGHAPVELTGRTALGPSAFEGRYGGVCEPMRRSDIQHVVDAMSDAAGRAQKAGFDGVQIHAAHGYLLSQFLSPATNRRDDAYGGSLYNRCRLVLEVAQAVRQTVGKDFPVTIKLNSDDFTEGGWTADEMVQLAALLAPADIDAVELSGGLVTNPVKTHCARKVHPKKPEQEVYYKTAARRFKQAVDLPLILVGGIRSLGMCATILQENVADFIAFGRPLIAEPDLVRRWSSGDRDPAACISCNRCYEPILAGDGVSCPVADERRDR